MVKLITPGAINPVYWSTLQDLPKFYAVTQEDILMVGGTVNTTCIRTVGTSEYSEFKKSGVEITLPVIRIPAELHAVDEIYDANTLIVTLWVPESHFLHYFATLFDAFAEAIASVGVTEVTHNNHTLFIGGRKAGGQIVTIHPGGFVSQLNVKMKQNTTLQERFFNKAAWNICLAVPDFASTHTGVNDIVKKVDKDDIINAFAQRVSTLSGMPQGSLTMQEVIANTNFETLNALFGGDEWVKNKARPQLETGNA